MIEQYKKQENLLEDYGINTYLLNLNTEIHKILESNTILKKENNTLKDRILGLESNISTLIENNKDLVNIIKILEKKEETQKNTEIIDKKVYVENKIDIKNQETNLNDKQINILEKDKTMEDYRVQLLEMDIKDYNSLMGIIINILSTKNEKIADNFAEYIINISQNILKNHGSDIVGIEILEFVKLVYEKLDEDLLIEFTQINYQYILKLIEDTQKKPKCCIIKIARILYSQEELMPADDYLFLLNFKYLKYYVKDEKTIKDLLLMYNHLLGCNQVNEINYLWDHIWSEGHVECNDILNYLSSIEELMNDKVNKVDSTIKGLKSRFSYIENMVGEVNSDLRMVSYNFMVNRLKKLRKNKNIEYKQTEIEETSPNNGEVYSDMESNYFDHRLYMIKNDREDCPFDSNEFLETTIVEKLYKSKNDMDMEKNKIYKEIEVQYCSSCKEYFIKEKVQKKIELYMNVIPVKAITIPAVEPVEAVEGEFFLNERSPLRIKGYHTGLNDNERWNILKGCCIPELGAGRVLYYLEGFVTRFSRQKKDYSNSIRVWKKDIIKVRKYIDDLKK